MTRINPGFARVFLFVLLIAGLGRAVSANQEPESGMDAVQRQAGVFAAEMTQRGVDAEWVRETLRQAQMLESVRRAVRPLASGQRKNWQAYRARFIEPKRTEAGLLFMQLHAETLTRASNQFGVPVEVIAGIIGVETFYGRNTGNFRVVDALATLAFAYPTEGRDRSPYFREQLAHFFVWCAKEQCQPLDVRGSYAGAIGIPQFMPENIHRYGTDFDSDGHIDLNNPVDAIGSVARFLARHGWVRELEPVFPVEIEEAQLEPLLAPDILPTFTPERLAVHGARPLAELPPREVYALVELENGDEGSEYVLGSRNFFVLTRYNRSSYYAMAVLQLGQEIAALQAATQAPNEPDGKTNSASECDSC